MTWELSHTRSHVIADPNVTSMVHALLSSQVVGQFPSQFSPWSMIRLPHRLGMSTGMPAGMSGCDMSGVMSGVGGMSGVDMSGAGGMSGVP